MSTFEPINIWSFITANHSMPCLYLCAQSYGYILLADETVVFYLYRENNPLMYDNNVLKCLYQ